MLVGVNRFEIGGKVMKMNSLNTVFKLVMCFVIMIAISSPAYANAPIGWAVVDALGRNGTTGGGDGEVVIVDSRTKLRFHAGRPEPLTIYVVDDLLVGSGSVKVSSNKSIIGLGEGATLARFGFDIDGAENIIIRNLTIKDVQDTDDAISIKDSHHIWIDHCELTRAKDGLLDITKGSDFITVSWTKFYDHDKNSLVNSGTNEFVDHDKCNVTYYNNWFAKTVQRNPRVGYGQAHIFNNYYSDIQSYGIGVHTRAKVLAENNYFFNSNNPIQQMYSSNEWDANYGDIESVGNMFQNSRGTTAGTGISFNPTDYYSYTFALTDVANVPEIVQAYAGPGAAYSELLIPVPGNGLIDLSVAAPELSWLDTREVESWDVFFGTAQQFSLQGNVTEPRFSPVTLLPNTQYYWSVAAHTAKGVIQGSLWQFRTAPQKATKPFPSDGQSVMPYYPADSNRTKPVALQWVNAFDAQAYDVYFGTSDTLGQADYLAQVTDSAYAPGRLPLGETYYWRVDVVLADGTIKTGDTWSFSIPVAYAKAGRTEAEDMVFGGRFFRESNRGRSGDFMAKIESGPGTLSAVWNESNALCDIDIAYYDQSGGQGRIALYVNENLIGSWVADTNSNQIVVRRMSDVQLQTGDEIRIEASSDLDMLTRIDYMDITVK